MKFSSTNNTEAEERFPTFRRQFHETSSAPLGSFRADSVASSTLGPPVCMIHVSMSHLHKPCAPRNLSTSLPKCSSLILGTSGESAMPQPCSELSQPITSSEFVTKMERAARSSRPE